MYNLRSRNKKKEMLNNIISGYNYTIKTFNDSFEYHIDGHKDYYEKAIKKEIKKEQDAIATIEKIWDSR